MDPQFVQLVRFIEKPGPHVVAVNVNLIVTIRELWLEPGQDMSKMAEWAFRQSLDMKLVDYPGERAAKDRGLLRVFEVIDSLGNVYVTPFGENAINQRIANMHDQKEV